LLPVADVYYNVLKRMLGSDCDCMRCCFENSKAEAADCCFGLADKHDNTESEFGCGLFDDVGDLFGSNLNACLREVNMVIMADIAVDV